MKKDPILVERTFNAPINKVWTALTDTSEMKQWYFTIENFDPKVGFKFDFIADQMAAHNICTYVKLPQ
ncbi:SRPBCC family protein [Pedobacter chitinilyticus]|uniref:SRPBCC family protein n=1 Tax=Pedobacter chitinilyticus TaxID=2233776 RepID=UPI0019691154|nr:SRPBCC domain-containing protein [Pedobacter chitinilyticus]